MELIVFNKLLEDFATDIFNAWANFSYVHLAACLGGEDRNRDRPLVAVNSFRSMAFRTDRP